MICVMLVNMQIKLFLLIPVLVPVHLPLELLEISVLLLPTLLNWLETLKELIINTIMIILALGVRKWIIYLLLLINDLRLLSQYTMRAFILPGLQLLDLRMTYLTHTLLIETLFLVHVCTLVLIWLSHFLILPVLIIKPILLVVSLKLKLGIKLQSQQIIHRVNTQFLSMKEKPKNG